MRKLIFQMMVSLDGYFEGTNGDISWHNVDDEFNEYAVGLLNRVDTLIFGRKTYEVMAAWWPTEQAVTGDPVVAERMNSLEKIVFSTTLARAEWQNTRSFRGHPGEVMQALKKGNGGDLAIFGSSVLAAPLAEQGLIDEFRIIVKPVILGAGRSLFASVSGRLRLKLLKTKTFRSGNVLLIYSGL
jgi:dihydrofolate reductase